MINVNPKVGIFDVDNTLSRGFYIVKFPEMLYQEGLFPKGDLRKIREIFEEYGKEDYPYEQFAWDLVKRFGRGIKGRKQEDIQKLGEIYIRQHSDEKFSFTDDLIRLLKNKGYRTIVIGGSPYEIVLPFSQSIGIDECFATTYETESGIFTGEVMLNCAINETKKDIVQRYVKEHEIDTRNSTGFGDSHNDLAFLELVGYPVAILPNQNLEEIAKRHGWLICKDDNKVLESVKLYLP